MTREHVDVLIVGAGLSGIGAAYHLQTKRPAKTYAILEARDAIGGTWDLFRYPGIRSDSDLHTLGYAFKPWREERMIADGPSIKRYIEETASENGIDRHIRFGHKVLRAAWDSGAARWAVTAERVDTGEPVELSCSWLFMAGGYYRYDEGFTPRFAGRERFRGTVVHPQHWPEDLDYTGKRVVIIGSGATAVTMVPAMTDRAAHVTQLQRTPSYVMSVPGSDPLADGPLGRHLSPEATFRFARRRNIRVQATIYKLSQRFPRLMKRVFQGLVRKQLPEGYDVDTHFNPPYGPWDQRVCIVPDGDLFQVIREGKASIVTDRIASFTEAGIALESGRELEADIVVTATGLNLLAFGGVELSVDGRAVELPETLAYKGMMLSGVPNFAYAIGYTNASWTLKVDLVCEHLCRLLAHMDANGLDSVVPEVEDDGAIERRPLLDFAAGYVLRAVDRFPRQGSEAPWQLAQDYHRDVRTLRRGPVADPVLRFGRRRAAVREVEREPVAVAA